MADKPNYTKPTSLLDLEDRQANGNASPRGNLAGVSPDDGNARDYTVEGNNTDDYIGVSPEYRNYANETERPFASEEGAEAQAEEDYLNAVKFRDEPAAPEASDDSDEDEGEDEGKDESDSTPSTPVPAPPTWQGSGQ